MAPVMAKPFSIKAVACGGEHNQVSLEPPNLFLYPEYETGSERRIDLNHENERSK